MGFFIDFLKSGTSSIYNTSRCAFAEQTAEILGIYKNFIFRFYIVFVTLSPGYEIDCLKFKDNCLETVRLCVLLIHGITWLNLCTKY